MCKKIIFLLILSLLIISCSEDNSSGPSNENGSGSQGSEIPCNTSNEGMVIKPADSETERICKDGVWEVVLNSSSSVQVVESSSSEIINIPVPVNSSANENFSSIGEESSSSILSSGETTESSSSETGSIEQSSSSSEEIVESSSSEETKLYLCEDGETYVLDPANCEKVSSSSVIVVSSSSSDVQESSSSELSSSSVNQESSSSDKLYSSDAESSSSSKKSSSSSFEITFKIYDCSEYECITTAYLNPEIEYGEYLDTRDNQVYRTVQIGEQVWMAQNLNYAANDSYCYKDSLTRCATVGRLYSWETALNVCPDGWHLPDTTEFNYLVDYITEQKESYSVISILSSKSNRSALYGSAYDFFGYSVVHGSGYKKGIWDYDEGGLFLGNTYFWTASESIQEKYPAETYARVRYFNVGTYETLAKLTWPKNYALAVRCIKD